MCLPCGLHCVITIIVDNTIDLHHGQIAHREKEWHSILENNYSKWLFDGKNLQKSNISKLTDEHIVLGSTKSANRLCRTEWLCGWSSVRSTSSSCSSLWQTWWHVASEYCQLRAWRTFELRGQPGWTEAERIPSWAFFQKTILIQFRKMTRVDWNEMHCFLYLIDGYSYLGG